MRIAICDNDACCSKKLKHLIYDYLNLKKFEFVVDVFKNTDDFLNSENNYLMLFLSCENENERLIAQKICETKKNTFVIITSHEIKFTLYAFKMHAFNFIHKPYTKETVFDVLEESLYNNILNSPIIIKSYGDTFCIKMSEILYLEAIGKHCIIHLKNQKIYCAKTMAQVNSILPQSCFLKINRSFIVNCRHVVRFNTEYVVLSNDEQLHPSRHFFKIFKENYLKLVAKVI